MTIERALVGTTDAAAAASVYVEDVFSTYLYTGNGSTQTITNGIDLSTKGGLVWIKARSGSASNEFWDTARSRNGGPLLSNTTDTQYTASSLPTYGVTSFDSAGFSLGSQYISENGVGTTYASWTFRKQAKFFDIVTYTGNGTAGRQIAHSLGATPGMIIVKCTSTATNWAVYHTSTGATKFLMLEAPDAPYTGTTPWYNTAPTSANFTVGTSSMTNNSGDTYVAYLFAHQAGGFGPAGTDSVVACGSFTGYATVNLGWEPQYILFKRTDGAQDWYVMDNMRGIGATGSYSPLNPNLSSAEATYTGGPTINANGFAWIPGATASYIYLAIRRPMKTPTDATKVFKPITITGAGTNSQNYSDIGFPADAILRFDRTAAGGAGGTYTNQLSDRLRGWFGSSVATAAAFLQTHNTNAEATSNSYLAQKGDMGFDFGGSWSGFSLEHLYFKRAPGFFDVVCYKANGTSGRQISHNLGVAPELMIVKDRTADGTWAVYTPLGSMGLNDGAGTAGYNGAAFFGNGTSVVTPTSSVFTVGLSMNWSTDNYVAYLFASCPGVSKVFSYTGNGSSQTINCGFAAGARFVLIKRTDSSGDWYVWDTARGIVSANDPHLSLNTIAAEVTTDDTIDPDNFGFIVNQVSATNVNVSSATYIGLAIA